MHKFIAISWVLRGIKDACGNLLFVDLVSPYHLFRSANNRIKSNNHIALNLDL